MDIQIKSGEKGLDRGDMFRLTVMAAADQREFSHGRTLAGVKRVPRLGKRDGLKRLHRRAGKDRSLDIPQTNQHIAVGIA